MNNSDTHQRAALGRALAWGTESRPGLLRVMGLGMALSMVVGNVIGSGIFLKPGIIAATAGNFRVILAGWILGGGLCILGGLCFAELAAMLPRAGGIYVYLREAYGRGVAFLFGWIEVLFGRTASIGALSVAFVAYLEKGLQPLGVAFGLWTEVLLSVLLISAMAWVNIIGAIWGGRVQAATTLIKAGFLALLALLPFLVMFAGYWRFHAGNYSTAIDFHAVKSSLATAAVGSGLGEQLAAEPTFGRFPSPAGRFALVMLAVMWAYNGWHGITPVAEEIRRPQRNIPAALFGGIGILILLYVAANVAYHGVLTMSELAEAGELGAQRMVEKLLTPGGTSMVHIGVATMSAVVMCSTFGAINSNMLNGPRISFAMGRDDVFFRQLGRVHVNYRTPSVAIVVQALMAAGLVVASGALVAAVKGFQQTTIFELLTNFVIFSASIFYVLSVAAVIVLRRRHPDWERPYRTWGYPAVPLLYIGFYAWFLFQVYCQQPFEAKAGLGLIALGVPAYFAWRIWAARHPEDIFDGQAG